MLLTLTLLTVVVLVDVAAVGVRVVGSSDCSTSTVFNTLTGNNYLWYCCDAVPVWTLIYWYTWYEYQTGITLPSTMVLS